MSCAVKFREIDKTVSAGATYTTGSFDTSGRKCLGVHVRIVGTISAGTIQLQHSNDNVNFGNNGTATSVTAAGNFFINVADLGYDFVRVQVVSTTGAITELDVIMVAKE